MEKRLMQEMKKTKWLRRWCAVSCLLLAGLLFNGCKSGPDDRFDEVPGLTGPQTAGAPGAGSPNATATPTAVVTSSGSGPASAPPQDIELNIVKPNDLIKVFYQDTPTPIPPFDGRVRADGTITLMYNKTFVAAGKSLRQLADEVRAAYVPSIFKVLTVQIEPQDTARFFFVDGEVKQPGQKVYLVNTTVTKAITAAGGFTDFAAKGSVKLIRSGNVTKVNCKKVLKHPELDPRVYPGDKIWVPRSVL
jgi:protein involved in polysaccharide export with SLBB domain